MHFTTNLKIVSRFDLSVCPPARSLARKYTSNSHTLFRFSEGCSELKMKSVIFIAQLHGQRKQFCYIMVHGKKIVNGAFY